MRRASDPSTWVSGLFIVLGALIAGGAGTATVLHQESYENSRLSTDDAIRAQGAARILGAELGRSEAELRAFAADGQMHPLDQPLTVSLSDSDYVLVAGKMKDSAWGSVAVAHSVLAQMNQYIEDHARLGTRKFTPSEKCALSVDIGIVVYGIFSLSAVTDHPEHSRVAIPNCGPAIPPG
jgi:hypothetical protein